MSSGFGTDPVPGVEKTAEPDVNGGQLGFTPETACLRVLNGPATGRIIRLNMTRSLIGRNDPPAVVADVDMTDCELGTTPMVSRRHAEMMWNEGILEIVDLCSKNGTWVNDSRLNPDPPDTPPPPVALQLGCVIRLADIELKVGLIDD